MKPDTTVVFSFPIKAPTGAVITSDLTAIEQLETWLMYQRHWCEHKPSVTINVRADEWFEVGAFVYKHFDEMSGVSFLPFNEHTYQQAPYQDVDKDTYKEMWHYQLCLSRSTGLSCLSMR
jgi:ribonucleoside-triphosphate reductase (thioredoxin)